MTIDGSKPYQAAAARQAGRMALNLLEQNESARVAGITSRGIFLAMQDGWVIFLTSEPNRGPLTVNLDRLLLDLHIGGEIKIEKDRLVGAGDFLVTGWSDANPWDASVMAPGQPPQAGWLQRLKATSSLVAASLGDRGLSELLIPLLGLDLNVNVRNPLLSSCFHLKESLLVEDWQAALKDIRAFLGYGEGLTPSGDDFILGLLLGLRRIPQILDLEKYPLKKSAFDMENFIDSVIQSARRQTTSLSASLIACVAQGQADERLISAFDGIYLGSLTPAECSRLLLAWGSSSGGDSLAGMALAFIFKCST